VGVNRIEEPREEAGVRENFLYLFSQCVDEYVVYEGCNNGIVLDVESG